MTASGQETKGGDEVNDDRQDEITITITGKQERKEGIKRCSSMLDIDLSIRMPPPSLINLKFKSIQYANQVLTLLDSYLLFSFSSHLAPVIPSHTSSTPPTNPHTSPPKAAALH